MNQDKFNRGISCAEIKVTDHFFQPLMEQVRMEVIPYQWNALNDRVEGAAPSFCMHNFQVAARLKQKRLENQEELPVFPTDQFNVTPESMDQMEERFYGFVFQDSDLYKWIEASAYSLAQNRDKSLEELVDGAVDCICAAQEEDGYLDTFYTINNPEKRFTNLRDHHELYCLGHLIEGAVAYYEATGKDKLLNAAKRFADCVDRNFGSEESKRKGYPGHEIAEMALVRLYEVTGEERYLKLAKYFVDERGKKPYYFSLERQEKDSETELKYEYNQAHKPVREQEEAVGHAVRAVYLYTGMAEVAKYTKDEELFAACERLFQNIMQKKLSINGGIGASPDGEAFSYNYNLPNDKMYNETCASIGLVFFARRMLELSPKSYYADVMERALYNGVISGMALDGKSFFYVNPLEVEPEGCKKDAQRKQVALPRQKWFGCACCPPNLARLISSIFSYAYSRNNTTLFCHLYLGGEFEQSFNQTNVQFHIVSSYPWEDTIQWTLSMEREVEFTIALRLPGWCENPQILVNQTAVSYQIKDGYAYLSQRWASKDTLTVILPMKPMFYQADTHVRADIGKVALLRGPLVYCLEEADNGSDLHLVEANVHAPIQVVSEEAELGNIIRLKAKGRKISGDTCPSLYHPWTGYQYEDRELNYIPYYTWCNRGVGEMTVYTRWF